MLKKHLFNTQQWQLPLLGVFAFLVAIISKYTALPLSPFMAYNTSVIGILLVAICILLLPNTTLTNTPPLAFYLLVLVVVIMVIYLQSRIGLLCFIVGLSIYLRLIKAKWSVIKWLLLIAVLTVISFAYFSFGSKSSSSIGRLFIWQNCFKSLLKVGFWGNGIGTFRAFYNTEKFNYFVANGLSNPKGFLAGNNYYAFNEWLQLSIEIGIGPTVGILLLIVLLLVIYYLKFIRHQYSFFSVKMFAAFITVLIGSLFSYPFYYIPTLFLFLVLPLTMLFSLIDRLRLNQLLSIYIFIFGLYTICQQIQSRVYWQ